MKPDLEAGIFNDLLRDIDALVTDNNPLCEDIFLCQLHGAINTSVSHRGNQKKMC